MKCLKLKDNFDYNNVCETSIITMFVKPQDLTKMVLAIFRSTYIIIIIKYGQHQTIICCYKKSGNSELTHSPTFAAVGWSGGPAGARCRGAVWRQSERGET